MSKPWHKESDEEIKLRLDVVEGSGGTENPPSEFFSNSKWKNFADGSTNPDYKAQLAASVDAGTGLVGQKYFVERTPGSILGKGWIGPAKLPVQERISRCTGDLDQTDYKPQLTAYTGIALKAATTLADSKFVSKAVDAIHAIEGGELLGELGQTVKEIKRLARGASSLVGPDFRRRIRRLKNSYKNPRRVAELVSDNYLAWKFGWDPLVKEAQALAKDLKDDYLDVITIKSAGSGKFVHETRTEPLDVSFLVPASKIVKVYEEATVRYKAGIRVTRYGVGGLTERLGLSPRNFVPTVYNLLPWTYMIDYFTNLGDIVSAIAFDYGRISWCNRTQRQTMVIEVSAGVPYASKPPSSPNWVNAPGYPIVVPSSSKWTRTNILRGGTRPEIPSLQSRLLNFQNEGDRTKGLNIAAVIASLAWSDGQLRSIRNG